MPKNLVCPIIPPECVDNRGLYAFSQRHLYKWKRKQPHPGFHFQWLYGYSKRTSRLCKYMFLCMYAFKLICYSFILCIHVSWLYTSVANPCILFYTYIDVCLSVCLHARLFAFICESEPFALDKISVKARIRVVANVLWHINLCSINNYF